MPHFRTCAAMLGAVLAMVAGSAGVAHAGTTNVVTAIKAQDKIINNSPGSKELKHLKVTSKAQVKKLIPVLTKLEKTSAHAVTVVSRSSTSSARQRQGKAVWIKGSKEQNRGLLDLRNALKDALAGNKTEFKSNYTKALKELLAGTRLSSKGDKLLGLPAKD